jgi:hypothetical protein
MIDGIDDENLKAGEAVSVQCHAGEFMASGPRRSDHQPGSGITLPLTRV